jgi:hypothetical protein
MVKTETRKSSIETAMDSVTLWWLGRNPTGQGSGLWVGVSVTGERGV